MVDVLTKVQGIFPGAKIAGGAIRDLLNDKPIKDVDIFCPIKECPDGFFLTELSGAFQNDLTLDTVSSYCKSDDDLDARSIYAVYKLGNTIRLFNDTSPKYAYKYDIILSHPAHSMKESFDLNLCQVEFDGTSISMTDAYKEAVQTKTLRVLNINRADRQKARLERILQKYPEYTVQS